MVGLACEGDTQAGTVAGNQRVQTESLSSGILCLIDTAASHVGQRST